jgi:hypothetical protein
MQNPHIKRKARLITDNTSTVLEKEEMAVCL